MKGEKAEGESSRHEQLHVGQVRKDVRTERKRNRANGGRASVA